jgi:hypothetical protein
MTDPKAKTESVQTEELTEKQKYIKAQLTDLVSKEKQLTFQLDQIKAAQQVFKQAFLDASKEVSEEILAENKDK